MIDMKMVRTRRRRLCCAAIPPAIALASLIVGSIAHASIPVVKFHTVADINSNFVRFGDVADLSTLSVVWQKQAADLVLARLHETDSRVVIESVRLAESARRQMPVITPWLATHDSHAIVITRRSTPTPVDTTHGPRATLSSSCLEITRDISKGDAIALESVRAVSCPQKIIARGIHYDEKSRLVRAAVSLARGDTIADVPAQRLAQISRGERIATVIQTGAITVTRTGTVLTDSARGRVTMIATDNRDIVAVPATISMQR